MPLEYSRALTGYAMAVSEVQALKWFLIRRVEALRKEADEIEKMANASDQHSTSWYEQLKIEDRAEWDLRKSTPAT